jgi:uncharacterized protein with von Willebrand factor type A (vWA) domain
MNYQWGNRYSRWDGTQQIDTVTAEEVMRAISDELMRDGDLMRALRQLFREGFERPDGERVPGWWEMMNRVRQQRQNQLQRYDLGSIFEDIKERLRDVIQTEREGIDRRVSESKERLAQQQQDGQPQQSGEQGEPQSGQQDAGEQGEQQPGQPEGQQSSGGDPSQSSVLSPQSSSSPDADLQQMLEQIAGRKRDQLDQLPPDPAGAIKGLQEYDFMDPAARQKFQELLAMLQQQVLQQTFQGMQQALGEMTPENIAEMRQMMSELNDMLEAQARGEDPNFEQFMHKWGHFFGPDVKNLDDLMEHMSRQMQAMNQLMESMTPEQRGQLEQMMQAIMQDEGLQQQMSRLAQNLGQMMEPGDERRPHRFSGEESISLAEAVRLMDRLNDYDELEQQLKEVRDWSDFANLDGEKIRDLLGEETQEQMDQLSRMAQMLEDAGFIKKNRRGFELTPQGVRKIGEKALTDIFQQLKKDKIGQHEVDRSGRAGERIDVTKPYEFGDPFLLDLPRTVMNAVQRGGAGSPVKLRPNDFEVYRTEHVSRSSTVLMIDMSRSMYYNQYFPSAKRIALALDSLIRSKYPRDTLRILGFSAIAHELKPTDLPGLTTNEYQVGTNMQHGFQLAREILGREKGSNRQIIIITDGEPTAHIENGEPFFSWPPTPETWQATLREVVRCTRDGITINTFMLERSAYLMKFVNDLSKINGGRVFYASPDHLGEYILVDYVTHKTKHVA